MVSFRLYHVIPGRQRHDLFPNMLPFTEPHMIQFLNNAEISRTKFIDWFQLKRKNAQTGSAISTIYSLN